MFEMDFNHWFRQLSGYVEPWAWQSALGLDSECRSRLIRVPAGLGKTAGVLAAWSFHRVQREDSHWPRRLVWCLPSRALIEPLAKTIEQLLGRIPESNRPRIQRVTGGTDTDEWYLYPESPAVVVGTQDMLLSRALNRGYGSPRARWPIEYGLLHQDALWVMDEAPLMDLGLATSAQLQVYREQDRSKQWRPCYTWWMGATLSPSSLETVDSMEVCSAWCRDPIQVLPADCNGDPWQVEKKLQTTTIAPEDHTGFARRVLKEHALQPESNWGRITLVVCNTVERARLVFESLQALGRKEGIELIHESFRPFEQHAQQSRSLHRSCCVEGVDRIIVATQIIEAGVDISANRLITELAPWSSLVQRFGRCARYGGEGAALVVDRRKNSDGVKPYGSDELQVAWETVAQLEEVGLKQLETFESALAPEARGRLMVSSPTTLLLRKEFDELFDTTADLTGAELDISRLIRSGEERDLQIFWLDVARFESPSPSRQPNRQELCFVPVQAARDWLCGEETKTSRKPRLRSGMRAWTWDWLEGQWFEASRARLMPGRIVCVASDCGGYREVTGFDATSTDPVLVVSPIDISKQTRDVDDSDSRQDGESLSYGNWKTIASHSREVADLVKSAARELGLTERLQDLLELAALWHDWGKSHPAYQGAIQATDRPSRHDLAKAPEMAWLAPPAMYRFRDDAASLDRSDESRLAFRHELAGALGLFAILEIYAPEHEALVGPWREVFAEMGLTGLERRSSPTARTPIVDRLLACTAEEFNLIAYLVASHHGKVRLGLHPAPRDQEYRNHDGRGMPLRGIREDDRLPATELVVGEPPVAEVSLTLAPASIGLSFRTGPSWQERCLSLLSQHGPTSLAYLEAVFRAADVRASRSMASESVLVGRGGEG